MLQMDAVQFEELSFPPAGLKPILATPRKKNVNLSLWLKVNKESLDQMLLKNGAVFFRGFQVLDEAAYDSVLESVITERFEYSYWSTPRVHLKNRIYTATEYPSQLSIPQHIESCYSRAWPMKLVLCCIQAPRVGGETPLSLTKSITERVPENIREDFARKGVMYVRNYMKGIDVPWQTVFQTDSREEVNEFCQKNDIEYTWRSDDWLQTRQVAQGMAKHPETGEYLWCNQAHLFHSSSIDEETRQDLLLVFGEDGLPRNSFFGDGTPFEEDTMNTIRRIYEEEMVLIPWESGDIAIVDNMLVHHGRNPFQGERRVLISMGGRYPVVGEKDYDVLPKLGGS